MCTDLKLKRNTVANNKICPVCSKVFAQKSNCDRHVTIIHSQVLADDIAFDEFDNQRDKQEQNQTKPSMVTFIETVPSEVPQSFPTEVFTNRPEQEDAHLDKMKSLNHGVQISRKNNRDQKEHYPKQSCIQITR